MCSAGDKDNHDHLERDDANELQDAPVRSAAVIGHALQARKMPALLLSQS